MDLFIELSLKRIMVRLNHQEALVEKALELKESLTIEELQNLFDSLEYQNDTIQSLIKASLFQL